LLVANDGGHTTARVYSFTHSQITLAASTLSPAFALPWSAKRKPLPFGSVPSGTFTARAAAEIAVGFREGAFGRTYLSAANVPEKPVSAAAVIDVGDHHELLNAGRFDATNEIWVLHGLQVVRERSSERQMKRLDLIDHPCRDCLAVHIVHVYDAELRLRREVTQPRQQQIVG